MIPNVRRCNILLCIENKIYLRMSFPVHVSHEIYSDVVRYVVVYLPNLSCTETYLREPILRIVY